MSSSSKEIFSIIDRLEAKLNDRTVNARDESMYKTFNFKTFSAANTTGKFYDDQLSRTPYQQLLQNNYYQKDVNESQKGLSSSSEYEIRKMIKEEFNNMIMPFQQDINKTFSIFEAKFESIEVSKGSISNAQMPLINTIDKQIDTKIKDLKTKVDEQSNRIDQITGSSQKQSFNNNNNGNSDGKYDDLVSSINNIMNEIKNIKEGNFNELKSLNAKLLKSIDYDSISKCDFKTLNQLNLSKLKELSQRSNDDSFKPNPTFNSMIGNDNDDKIKEMNGIISELNKKVMQSIEVTSGIQNMKLNDKICDINNQLFQLQNQINDVHTEIEKQASKTTSNKNVTSPTSPKNFNTEEMTKINQQFGSLKQQVVALQSKQAFFIEANVFENVTKQLTTKIEANDPSKTVNDLNRDMTQLKNEIKDIKRETISDLNKEISDLKSEINTIRSEAKNTNENQTRARASNTSALDKAELMEYINSKVCNIPSKEAFEEECQKTAQLENKIFILEASEKELPSIYAQKDDIKIIFDEIDKINEVLENVMNDNQQMDDKKADYYTQKQPEVISTIQQPAFSAYETKEEPKKEIVIKSKPSPFAMAEKDEIGDDFDEENDNHDYVIDKDNKEPKEEYAWQKKTTPESAFVTAPMNPKEKKKADNSFDDFDVEEIEDMLP